MTTELDMADLAVLSVERAQNMVCLVRDEGREVIGETLDPLTRTDLYGLIVALAAMVPDDQPAARLLSWIRWEPQTHSDSEITPGQARQHREVLMEAVYGETDLEEAS